MSAIDQLLDMGFPKEKAEKAISMVGNNAEQAMEWLLAHADELDASPAVNIARIAEPTAVKSDESLPMDSSDAAGSDATGSGSATTDSDEKAKSLKCEDCNRLFRTQLEVEFHASKSGHSNFSESTEEKKPLTEEEKKAQLALLEEKMKQKRFEREEKEKKEALEKEKNRIKSGKNMTEIKKSMEDQEMKKIMEERKREKQEEKIARDRVRALVEADRLARKNKAAMAAGQPIEEPAVTSTSPTVATVTSPIVDYQQTRIQIRLPDGTTLTETFEKQEPLAAVRLFVQLKRGDPTGIQPFGMMTNFPRKVFQGEDYEMRLDNLGLVPSAVIIVTKSAS